MKFLIWFSAFVCIVAGSTVKAQSTSVLLDSLSFIMANVQDSYDASPYPEGHPQYKEPRVDVIITFKITNVDSLKQVNVVFEKEKDKKNFKVIQLQYVVADGKSYLTAGNHFYPIQNGKAIIREQVNAELMRARHRMIGKKIPGGGTTYYVYDKLDRLILEQQSS
ncbi:MAG: hypothetical protein JWM14_2033 [Chitinophagaceae bacterium]|nr:hypothetical protein [Chitinophagaceae bacterium]